MSLRGGSMWISSERHEAVTSSGTVTVVAEPEAAEALGPLFDAWAREGRDVRLDVAGIPDAERLGSLAGESGAVLVIGPRNRSPRTVLPGPVVWTGDRAVPVAWLPRTSFADLRTFAVAAAAVHARSRGGSRTLAVLGERHPRFDRLAEGILRVAREDRSGALVPRRWTAYDVDRADLARRLGRGPGLAVYVGHGRPIGWVGYAGLRIHHLSAAEPVGAIVSLTCKTASRRRTGLSFAEALPLHGIAAAALGAVGPTLHTANARWAVRLTRAAAAASSIGDLIVASATGDPSDVSYRLLGDPTAPLDDAVDLAASTRRRQETP